MKITFFFPPSSFLEIVRSWRFFGCYARSGKKEKGKDFTDTGCWLCKFEFRFDTIGYVACINDSFLNFLNIVINSLKSIRFPRKFSSIKLLYKSFVKKRVWKIIQILKFNLILHCVTKRARLCNILLSTLKNKSVHFFFNSKSSDFRSKKKLDRMTWRKKEKRKKEGEIRSRGTKRVSRSWWNRESLYN